MTTSPEAQTRYVIGWLPRDEWEAEIMRELVAGYQEMGWFEDADA